jgi:hypothetical protein
VPPPPPGLLHALGRNPRLRRLVRNSRGLTWLARRLAPTAPDPADATAAPWSPATPRFDPAAPRPRATPQQRRDIAKATAVVADMLAAGEALRQRPVLMAHLKRFGLAMNTWDFLAPWQDWFNASSFGVLQTPSEYVDYLLYAADKSPASCVEIGVYTGGLSIFSCAFFQALNPRFRYLGIDIEDKLIFDSALLAPLNLEFRIPCSSHNLAGEVFDLVFIDGDHSYDWAKRDWLNLGRHAAKLCAFHDIHGKEYIPRGGGIYGFWRHLRATLAKETTLLEFAHAPEGAGHRHDSLWMGIGVLDYTRR